MRAGPADRLPRTHLPTGPKDNRLASTPGQATLVEPQALNSAGGGTHSAIRLVGCRRTPAVRLGAPRYVLHLTLQRSWSAGPGWPDSDVRRQPVSRNPGGLAPAPLEAITGPAADWWLERNWTGTG